MPRMSLQSCMCHACGLQHALLYRSAAWVLPTRAQHLEAGSSWRTVLGVRLARCILLHVRVCTGWQRTVKFAFPETCWISD